eukprot:14577975-Alexandrium_andersonii.AAC.1
MHSAVAARASLTLLCNDACYSKLIELPSDGLPYSWCVDCPPSKSLKNAFMLGLTCTSAFLTWWLGGI